MKAFDLLNREIKVGQHVVVGKDWARDCDYLIYGLVSAIFETEKNTRVVIDVFNGGRWNYGKDTSNISKYERQITYNTANRKHNNIFIVK